MTRRRLLLAILFSTLGAFAIAALLVNIFERRQEGRRVFFQVVELSEDITDPEVWGRNFPLQYDDYLRTADHVRTRYGGSEALPHIPTEADPRHVVTQSKIDEDPRLKTMWAGYAFATDFREERGHAYMLIDQRATRRVLEFNQPGTCLNCHASTWNVYRQLGGGDIFAGFDKLNAMTYAEATEYATHPIACVDCHDPVTMRLRVTRPAFMNGIRALKASQGVADYDVNIMASPQEMRTYVCGQCHVEYYFRGSAKTLTYPWSLGLRVDRIYEAQKDHADWVHAETGANALKAQHPEFEMYSQGVHARSGVSCADCHMPYRRVGGAKVSDHHVSSPLLKINRACQTCHHFPEQELLDRVNNLQDRFFDTRNRALDALMELIAGIKARRDAGATDVQLAQAREFQRRAQFYIDFVEAENSTGFHAPQEAFRVLAEAIDYVRQGQLSLR
jgi:nitrite reductase (cytochrome c-552)